MRIRPEARSASGGRKGWIKHVTHVDTSGTNGYAFSGDFLPAGREVDLPVGAILLRVDPQGSVKNGWKSATVLRVESDGSLITVGGPDSLDWRDDFLTIRDTVADALNVESPAATVSLAEATDDQLTAEARRRGIL